ncbi:hypothetical protein ACFYP4_21950 [Streptomyces sp. NPDC005551]|uniref:hypothetical protein n=1 Tax=unclassified Streptomyces TaxID=2593676 RepID=UPI0033FFAF9C
MDGGRARLTVVDGGQPRLRRRDPGRRAAAARIAGVVTTVVVMTVDMPTGTGRRGPPV